MSMLSLLMGFSFIAYKVVLSRKELIKLATRDPLTGIVNRREFVARGQNENSRASRLQSPLSLLMMDLDYFKRINDTHGHAQGDLVLKKFVETCQKQIRATDVLARLGGEEFGLLLPDADNWRAMAMAERLRRKIEATPIAADSSAIRLTVSIGVSTREGEQQDLSEMMRIADRALYRAKEEGRNRVNNGSPPPEPPAKT